MTSSSLRAPVQLPDPPDGANAWLIDVYAHTHWDREWYLPFEQYRLQLVNAIDRVLDAVADDPAFTCFVLDGQTIVLDDYLELRPERADELRERIASGRIEVGPWYILPDEFLVSGESLIRNLAEGRRGAARFGDAPPVGYLPDPFGHVAQLPQVLAGFGIGTVIFSRGMGDEYDELGSEFRWEGLDGGDSVVAIVQAGAPGLESSGYCNASFIGGVARGEGENALAEADILVRRLVESARTNVLLFAAGEDHSTVHRGLPGFVAALDERYPGAQARIVGLREVVGDVLESERRRAGRGDGFARYQGELRGSLHCNILANIFSARIPLKQDNVRLQNRLERTVEPLLALSELAGVLPADLGALRHAWRLALQNQPHDSIGGCSVDATHDDMPGRTKRALEVCDGLVGELALALGAEFEELVFHAGVESVSAIVERCRGERLAVRDVPGLQLSRLAEHATEAGRDVGVDGDRGVYSDTIKVWVDEHGRVCVERFAGGAVVARLEDVLRFEDVADAGDEYDFGALAGDVPVEASLVRVESRSAVGGIVELEVEHELLLPAGLTQDRSRRSAEVAPCRVTTVLRVAGGVPWVECESTWDNTAVDHRLRLVVALDGAVDEVRADGHFALLRRPAQPAPALQAWRQPPAPVGFCESVVAARGSGDGVALLTRGLHEYEVCPRGAGSTLELTLLRATGWLSRDDIVGRPFGHAGPELAAPGGQSLGLNRVEFAIAPLGAGDEPGVIATMGRRFASPPIVVGPLDEELPRHGAYRAWTTDIRERAAAPHGLASFNDHGLSLAGTTTNVVLSAIKPAEDGSGDHVVRCFSVGPGEGELVLAAPAGCSITRVRLDEQVVDGGAKMALPARVTVREGEILTLRLTRPRA